MGVPLGIIAGSWRVFEAAAARSRFWPQLTRRRADPLTILWFGIDESQKVMFIFIATIPFVYSDAASAVASVPDRYVETAQTLGASSVQIVRKVLVALALPDIYNSLRHLFGLAFGYIMLAELINAQHGLGLSADDESAARTVGAHHPDSDDHRAARLRHRSLAVLVPAGLFPHRSIED